ncbi:hypothetical protein [Sphingomonas psychrotolerans]|uniref:Uncharacterized protein n=1 Tax=Sphingomonas psychrotolerans TaxID=1327635 RepID=A0A2K8MGD9_9SPHN|nr:hypothetical protein [Sphingomonas psychrotolerans]ATY32945.1 hypothetical protein CVN68_14045 [Sphingomonas psychrotolerans]
MPAPPPTRRPRLQWATSKRVGNLSEIAVLAPIRKGCVPGETMTWEETLRGVIANITQRVQQGLPSELDKVPTIHFGRMIILRPEQYLVYSENVAGLPYEDQQALRPGGALSRQIPQAIDDFREAVPQTSPAPAPEFRSWILTLVEFDGDLKVYMRDIARILNSDFDRVFRNCEDYPGTRRFEQFWQWIRRYQINTDLFYAPYAELSVARLKQLEAFKRRFDAFVARVRSPLGPSVRSMDELFDEFLRENQQYARDFPSPGGVYRAAGGEGG